MAGGFAGFSGDYPGKMTPFVFLICLVAATGGLNFGYEIGISGGLIGKDSPFLKKFFPKLQRQMEVDNSKNPYCKFDSQRLTAFMSSLYLVALVASFFTVTVTRALGRNRAMTVGGVAFLVGAAVSGAAGNEVVLFIGRMFSGVGVGFVNQSALLYLSEMAPTRLRGMVSIGFQLMVTIGILAANLVNYGALKIESGWGWRLSLSLAAVPAAILTVGSLFLPDTPNSLIHRGRPEQARAMLCRIRSTPDVEEEYNDLVAAWEASKPVRYPWIHILKRRYRPLLSMAIFIPFFQQLTGINVIMFYAPVVFDTIKLTSNANLMSAVITGLVNVFATFVSIFSVDRVGRRRLFLVGGIQMVVCLVVVGSLIGVSFSNDKENVSKLSAGFIVAFICIYVAGFAWSWGPLGWLLPTEIFPMEIRSEGQSLNLSVNMLLTFVIAQAFLSMLCHMKFGLFYYFAVWVVVMTTLVYFFLPETKSVPIEQTTRLWRRHWFWRRYVPSRDQERTD